jgi:hypothetical protein
VARVIIEATYKIQRDEDLSISFIQVGDDENATRFLKSLDDNLTRQGAKFDIVDTVTQQEMNGMTFNELIVKSIID